MILPAEDNERPAGRDVWATRLHVYGLVPPVADRVAVRALPTVPAGKLEVVMTGEVAAASRENSDKPKQTNEKSTLRKSFLATGASREKRQIFTGEG